MMTAIKYLFFCSLLAASFLNAGSISLTNFPPQGPFIDTLRLKMLHVKGEFFFSDADEREIKPLADDNLKFTYRAWMQEKPAPLVFALPGLGGHCAGETQTAFAEMIFNAGFSVVMITSPFNWDFLLNASTAITPGYTPYDAKDAYNVIKFILMDLKDEYGTNAITKKILTGYSLGALETIFIAALDNEEKQVGFERYVAISPPVNLLYAMKQLDDLYSIWTNWSDATILTNTIKITTYYKKISERGINRNSLLKLAERDAKYTIGIVYRRVLAETLKTLLSVRDYAFVKHAYGFTKRELDKELERFSYFNYIKTFFKFEHPELWTNNFTLRTLNANAGLPAVQTTLLSSTNIYIFHAANDFLLTDYDRKWLAKVMKNNITFFDRGGHLGYFYTDEFQTNFIRALNGLPIKNDTTNIFPISAAVTNLIFKIDDSVLKEAAAPANTNISENITEIIEIKVDKNNTNNTISLPPNATAAVIKVTVEPQPEPANIKKTTAQKDGIILETIEE